MTADDTHSLGYRRVDDDPNVAVLLATMDATATWEATRRLRAWERTELCLARGWRLLDVGCGLGEAALALADDLGNDGEIVGIDISAEMVHAARSKATAAPCRTRFAVGDACSIAEPDDAFDAVRSERTLQWLGDPMEAVAEMARVLRPGGRLSLIDTDWSTFAIDIGDDELDAMVRQAMRTERGRPSTIGRRLNELVRDAGLVPVARTEATQTWTSWDPDATPAPGGCFSMESLADDLVDAGQLAAAGRDRLVARIHDAARRGRFSMELTMYGVVASAPSP
ncbi:MAG: methyltransferase domain-containing protein [Chloroflexota bacterium]